MMGLVYIGKVLTVEEIPGADFIERLDVACGKGGKWSGCAQKGQFQIGDSCQVYLQDSLLPQTEEFAFMAKHKYRVRMMRLRGVPSECLIMPQGITGHVGDDITSLAGVERYVKPLPLGMGGEMAGAFPTFIPKTDEPNFQAVPELVEALRGQSFYATVKADGTSTTAYRLDDHFGVCSRNWEMRESDTNVQWHIANTYHLRTILPDGLAVQWETVGPRIQNNPMGLKEPDGLLFDMWYIREYRYGDPTELASLASLLRMNTVSVLECGNTFDMDDEQLRKYAEGKYPNGRQREGVVIRSMDTQRVSGDRLSFKVLNLKYKD